VDKLPAARMVVSGKTRMKFLLGSAGIVAKTRLLEYARRMLEREYWIMFSSRQRKKLYGSVWRLSNLLRTVNELGNDV
jgi:hypothetical protein